MNTDNLNKYVDAAMPDIRKPAWDFMMYGINHADELEDEEDIRYAFNDEFKDYECDIMEELGYVLDMRCDMDTDSINNLVEAAIPVFRKTAWHFMIYGLEHAEKLEDEEDIRNAFDAEFNDYKLNVIYELSAKFDLIDNREPGEEE